MVFALGIRVWGGFRVFGFRVQGFKEGDWVACGGLTANHAEMVSVPENLCVKLRPECGPEAGGLQHAGRYCHAGGAQADLRLGRVARSSDGAFGQLTCLLLRAAGAGGRVDIDQRMVAIAGRHCAELALARDAEGIQERIVDFTGGWDAMR